MSSSRSRRVLKTEDEQQRRTAEELKARLLNRGDDDEARDLLRNDEDYVRRWLELASSVADAEWVFEMVDELRIGEALALRWVAQAFVAEKNARYAAADEIFSRGAACDAQPRDLLDKRRREFDRRMKRHWLSLASSSSQKGLSQQKPKTAVRDAENENSTVGHGKKTSAQRRPLRVLEKNENAPATQSKINRKLVFSTAKRDAPSTTVLRRNEDLTINSAIAFKEIDDIFFDGSTHRADDDDDDDTVGGRVERGDLGGSPAAPLDDPPAENTGFAIFCDG